MRALTVSALGLALAMLPSASLVAVAGPLNGHPDAYSGWTGSTDFDDDGWPADWPLTNDAEEHLPAAVDQGTPWVLVVYLSDMEVVTLTNEYSDVNVDDLVALVEGL